MYNIDRQTELAFRTEIVKYGCFAYHLESYIRMYITSAFLASGSSPPSVKLELHTTLRYVSARNIWPVDMTRWLALLAN